MAITKLVYGGQTKFDISDTTATADKILSGYTAYGSDGNKLTGTATSGGATITVRYSSLFYNKTITCSNGSKTYTKTTTSSGSTEFSVSDEGTWTITCNGVSVAVSVVLSYSTEMRPTGSTATPVNDIQLWLKCGGIFNKTYTTINQVLADTTTLLALISDNNAVDYMVRSTNWASSVCANATAMTDIGANNYCANTLLSDATWASAIANSTYWESVLQPLVPVMTSNTTPSGVASASTEYSGMEAYTAFAGMSNQKGWAASSATTSQWLQYEFPTPTKVYKVKIRNAFQNTYNATLYCNDSVTAKSGISVNSNNTTVFDCDTIGDYSRYKLTSTTNVYAGYGLFVQFYGRASS